MAPRNKNIWSYLFTTRYDGPPYNITMHAYHCLLCQVIGCV